MKQNAKLYIAWVSALGSVAVGSAIAQWHFVHADRFPAWFLLAVIAATMKLRIPGIQGTFSGGSAILLIAFVDMEYTPVLLITCAVAAAQTLLNVQSRPRPVQLLFNVAANATAMGVSWLVCRVILGPWLNGHEPALMAAAACVYFSVNTLLVSGVIALVDLHPLLATWRAWMQWAVPYFLTGSALAVAAEEAGRRVNWMVSLAALPTVSLAWLTFRAQLTLSRQRAAVVSDPGHHPPRAHP